MKDHHNQSAFTTICVIFIALFVNVWALVCAVACYATFKVLQSEDNRKKERMESSKPEKNSASKEASSTSSNINEERPETKEFISQTDIDNILNGSEEDPFTVKKPS